MKSKIKYSRFAIVLTATLLGTLFIGCIVTVHEKPVFFPLLSIFLILVISAFLYGAAYLKADRDKIVLCSILKSIKIPIRNVASIELFQPTMGAIRVFGSGGFMGYWGIFKEGDIGRYYAFYGKASDCFLIRLTNGDKYVLGCENPEAMADYIRGMITEKH